MFLSRVICCPRLSSRGFGAALIISCLFLGSTTTGCSNAGVSDDSAASAEISVSLELLTTIGCADCDDARQITPTVIALLNDGRLAVLDRYEPFVRVFAPDGEPETSFGSPGQGPGELGNDMGGMYLPGVYLLPWPGGELSVVELMPAVIETFAPDGTFLHRETLELPFSALGAQAFAPRTGTYFRHSYIPVSDLPDVIERCVINVAGGSDCGQLTTATTLTGTAPEGFRATLSTAVTPQGELVVADAATYRLWVLNDTGTVVRRFGRDIPLPLKSEVELEAERSANRERVEAGRPEREIAPHRAHIAAAGLQVDGAGRIWVLTQRYTSDTWVFDVLDADGTFLNEVSIDALTRPDGYQVTPFVVAGDRLAAISNQPDGSARINVYRVVES